MKQRGFSVIESLVVLVVVGIIGLAGWWVIDNQADDEDSATATSQQEMTDDAPMAEQTPLPASELDLTSLWSYGLTSKRTGEPIITAGHEHRLDETVVEYGYNIVTDLEGNTLRPSGAPLEGGEQLVRTDDYQTDSNVREYARIFTIMGPVRDTILYRFQETSLEQWQQITEILTKNNIKTTDAPVVNGQSILSTNQVYEYVSSGPDDGSPVMRYLEEAELELKCLAFTDFDFTNPEGDNHCQDHGIAEGSGLVL